MDVSFQDLQASVTSSLIAATRTTTSIAAEDLAFQRSLDPTVARSLDRQNARLLSLAGRLLAGAVATDSFETASLEEVGASASNRKTLLGPDDTDDVLGAEGPGWRRVVDTVDSLLEKADTALDEFTGVIKRGSPSSEQAAHYKVLRPSNFGAKSKVLVKPQTLFEDAPDNFETLPFKPLLTTKPHAQIPLEEALKLVKDEDGKSGYPHPYQTEIESYKYPKSVYEKNDPIKYRPFETTTATFVETPEAMYEMLAELKQAKEIAIDVEHHDLHSYTGIVSLLQISTRDKDWIIDTLKPWRRRLECLNEVFADPNILKVLHGAHMDVIWLQRDLGLYLVGLFDTFVASRTLGYAGNGLAFLLKKFVNFDADKRLQRADWRIRPLPADMFNYARSDTHFLLYIYDKMRNELLSRSTKLTGNPESDRIAAVLEGSKALSLQKYETPAPYDVTNGSGPSGWARMLLKTSANLNREQFAVFRAVHVWRDVVARQEDESPLSVIGNHLMWSIARSMPTDTPALFKVAPTLIGPARHRAKELVDVIAKAKVEGREKGPELSAWFDARLKERKAKQDAYFAAKRGTPETPAEQQTSAIPQDTQVALSTDVSVVRAEKSQFWGSLLDKVKEAWQKRKEIEKQTGMEDVRLAVPLPALTAEVFADPNEVEGAKTPKAEDPGARAAIPFMTKEERDERAGVVKEDKEQASEEDVFTLKEKGGGRKSKKSKAVKEASPESGMDIDADELMLPDSEAAKKAEKKRRKKLAKANEEAAKQAEQASEDQQAPKKGKKRKSDALAGGEEEEEAFDYANAKSVLNAEPEEEQSSKKKGKRERKQAFNPYKGATDVPKGLSRRQKEKPGRSGTFKQ